MNRYTRNYGYDHNPKESIWAVDDNMMTEPERRFARYHNPLIEAVCDSWDGSFLSNAPVPDSMVNFVTKFIGLFRVVPSKFVDTTIVIEQTLRWLDFSEPYLLLVDSKVQLTNDSVRYTYKDKKTRETLSPEMIEVFAWVDDWDYAPYKYVQALLTHPKTKEFLSGHYIPEKYLQEAHRNGGTPQIAWEEALHAEIMPKIAEAFYSSYSYVRNAVAELQHYHYEGASETEEIFMGNHMDRDFLFWMLAFLGTTIWLKGPNALGYLTNYHPVYGTACDYADDGTVVPNRWGGKVVVDGTWLYSLEDVAEIQAAPPGTCEMCATPSHCTKLVNITAIRYPDCSCGQKVNPLDIGMDDHNRRQCSDYDKEHPTHTIYVCQRCLCAYANKLDMNATKCGRTICPATHCKHHMGYGAHYAALTQRRTNQLTSSRPR